jgi:hypothetical protein
MVIGATYFGCSAWPFLFMDKLDQFIKAVEEEYERTLQLALKNSNESWEVRLNTLLTVEEVAKDYRDTGKILL